MDNYNWRKYNLITKGKFREEDIFINFSEKSIKYNKITKKLIEESWQDTVKGNKSVGKDFWDSIVYRLNKAEVKDAKLVLDLSEATFKDLQGTNATHWILKDIYGSEYLANGILVQAVVYSSDGNIILGKRNTGVKKQFEQFAVFGGTIDKDELIVKDSETFFDSIRLELKQEIEVEPKEIESLVITHLVEDWKHYPVFTFEAKLRLTTQELQDKFKNNSKVEHSQIMSRPLKVWKGLMEKSPEKFSDLTLLALNLVN